MKKKRMIKLLMSIGFDRNAAVRATDVCDGSTSQKTVIEGDMTGAVAGMLGSHLYG